MEIINKLAKIPEWIGAAILAGIGFLIHKFWITPVLSYKELKSKIAHDLTYYANAIEVPRHDCPLRDKSIERQSIFRSHAASMESLLNAMPFWFVLWLKFKPEYPNDAIPELMYIANANHDGCALDVAVRYKDLKRYLNIV